MPTKPEYKIKGPNKKEKIDLAKNPGIAKRIKNLPQGMNLNKEMYTAIMDGYDGYSLKDMATFYGPKVFATLCDLALNGKAEETKLKAAALIADRIYGKVNQGITIDGTITHQLGVVMLPAPTNIIDAVVLDDTGDILELPSHPPNYSVAENDEDVK